MPLLRERAVGPSGLKPNRATAPLLHPALLNQQPGQVEVGARVFRVIPISAEIVFSGPAESARWVSTAWLA